MGGKKKAEKKKGGDDDGSNPAEENAIMAARVDELKMKLVLEHLIMSIGQIWSRKVEVLRIMVIFGVPTRNLIAEMIIVNKFSEASGGYSRVRNEKIYRTSLLKRNS